jgi:hypothetical protein
LFGIVERLIILALDLEVCDALMDCLVVLSNEGDRLDTEEGRIAHTSVELPRAVLGLGVNTPVGVLEEIANFLEAGHVLHPDVSQVVWDLVYLLNKQLPGRLLLSV